MPLKCFLFGHDWGAKFPWSTMTIEVPFDGDFMVRECKRCRKLETIPGSETGPGKQYVRNTPNG